MSPTPPKHAPRTSDTPHGRSVPIEELVDPALFGDGTKTPHPYKLRDALPPGWILEPDLKHARRDRRVLAGGGWVLVIGMISFGTVAFFIFRDAFPKGFGGFLRLGAMLAIVLLAGGIVGPMVTRIVQGPSKKGTKSTSPPKDQGRT
jgi:hypothetical protein